MTGSQRVSTFHYALECSPYFDKTLATIYGYYLFMHVVDISFPDAIDEEDLCPEPEDTEESRAAECASHNIMKQRMREMLRGVLRLDRSEGSALPPQLVEEMLLTVSYWPCNLCRVSLGNVA